MDVWMMNEYDGDISIYKLEIEWTWWCQNGILIVIIFRWSLVNPPLYPESWWLSIVFSVANGRKLQTHQNIIVVNISHNVFPFKLYIYIHPYFCHTNCWSVTSPSVVYFYLCHYIIYIYNYLYIYIYRYLYFCLSHEFLWHIPILSHSTPTFPSPRTLVPKRTLSSKSAEYQDRRGTTKTSCCRTGRAMAVARSGHPAEQKQMKDCDGAHDAKIRRDRNYGKML